MVGVMQWYWIDSIVGVDAMIGIDTVVGLMQC